MASKIKVDTLETVNGSGSITLNNPISGFTSTGIDDNATSTAVTIDASENVLVGKTTTDFGTEGIVLFHSNDTDKSRLHVTSDSTTGGYFNRLGNDGEAIRLYRQGNLVGGVGVTSSGAYITLGGTGAANTLDDYEEGTWTPAWEGSQGQSGQSYSTREATYTKIGRAVNIQCYINISDRGNFSGTAKIVGLPFTVSPSNQAAVTFGYHSGFNLNSGNSLQGWVYSGNFFYLYQGGGSTDSIALAQSATDTGPTLHFSFTYFTSD
jgi:hypothetical protein